MTNKEIINNIFKQKNAKITLLITVLFVILFSLASTKYMIPSFEKQIMLNIIDESKRVSNHLISVYKRDKSFEHMKQMKEDLNIEKIKFFDKKGLILYSTSEKDIGQINTKEYYHNIVVKGKVFYKIVKKGKKTLEGREIKVDVAEVYIPIIDNGKFTNAFEVYYDISSKIKIFNDMTLKFKIINYITSFLIFIIVLIRLYNTSKLNLQESITQQQIFKSEKMASMGEMIGNIAHQWRQPLSAISSSVTGMQLLKLSGVLDDKEFDKACKNITDNVQHLSATIDDFRNYVNDTRKLQTFDLSETIDSFHNLTEASAAQHNINLILDIQPDIKLNGYPNELIQCLINIFNNAKDILEERKIDERIIFIQGYTQKERLFIKIRDNAGGIPKDILPKIFEPYFTTKHQSQGTGLGLHMTYSLITEGMRGMIEADNKRFKYRDKDYQGAEFTISIPLN